MAKGGRFLDRKYEEVREMRNAESVLAVIRQRGERQLPLDDVYRQLFNPALYREAYGKIYRNQGAMTKGVTGETADGMSERKIAHIIELLRYERYRWNPARRVYIEKKDSKKKRPLGIPTWSDKLLQEVIRTILNAYYEPQFSDSSHGFRPGRGCHTALQKIDRTWKGTTWFIEGDISGCFDHTDHARLMGFLREKIVDNRFTLLIERLLKAGYLEEWKHHATLSGTPQGGIVSPILANIYLDRLDQFVERTLVPMYDRGEKRVHNNVYNTLASRRFKLRRKGEGEEADAVLREMRKLPSYEPNDPNYRRLRYVRYADDFLLGFTGPRAEAEEIKQKLSAFLRHELKLTLSAEKTLITHGLTDAARFLGYEVKTTLHGGRTFGRNRQRQSGTISLLVPRDVITAKMRNYSRNGKLLHRAELLNNSTFDIITQYQQTYRGLAQYYVLAHNRAKRFGPLKWYMETSLTKTLASKQKISVQQVYTRYRATIINEHGSYKGLKAVVNREGKAPLVAYWGGISCARVKNIGLVVMHDQPAQLRNTHSELVQRLLADTCEICGSQGNVEVHHTNKLRNLQAQGKRELPYWKQVMITRQRRTLVLCKKCHTDMHAGRLDGKPDTGNGRAG